MKTGTVGARPAISINKAAIGGGNIKEGGGAAGFVASRFNMAEQKASFAKGINGKIAVNAERMTVMGGQPVQRRTGLGERATAQNFARPQENRTPVNRTPTNEQFGRALGRRIGEFNPAKPNGSDVIKRGNGKYSLPPEQGPITRPVDSQVRQRQILNEIQEAYSRPRVDLAPKIAPIEVSKPTPKVEAPKAETKKPAAAKEPQSPNVMRIMAELNKIAERTKAQAAQAKAPVSIEGLKKFDALGKKVDALKKESTTPAVNGNKPSTVEKAVSLLKKKNDAKTGDAPSGTMGFDAIRTIIRRRRQQVEEEIDEAQKKKKDTNVIPLMPTDPTRSTEPQRVRTDGGLAQVISINRAMRVPVTEANPAIAVAGAAVQTLPEARPEPLRVITTAEPAAIAAPAAVELAAAQPSEQNENVVYMADRRKPAAPRTQPPETPPEEDPEQQKRGYSLAEQILLNRIEETIDGVQEQARLTQNGLVSGEQIFPYLTNDEKVTSPVVAVGSDMSNKYRTEQTRSLAPAAPEAILAEVKRINFANRPAKWGIGQPIGPDELRKILGNQPLNERRPAA